MDIRQLRYFVKIVECGSYVRAAEALGVTQSALTQSIHRLEERLDARLIERGRAGVTLTEAGRLLLPRAKLVAAEVRLAESELRHSSAATRARVAVGVGKSIPQHILPDAVIRLHAAKPDAAVTVTEGWSPELLEQLLEGELDFVVSAPLPHLDVDPDLRQKPLFVQEERVIVGAGHPLADVLAPMLEDLAAYRWLTPMPGNGRISHLQRVFQAAGADAPTDYIRSDDNLFGMTLVKRGHVVAHGIIDLVRQSLLASEYRVLNVPALSSQRTVYLTTRRRSRLQDAAADLAGHIRAISAESGLPPADTPPS